MSQEAALRAALSLYRVPTQARLLRASSLPDGVTLLLKVAVCEDDALAEAKALTARPVRDLINASGFFIEQVLLHPDADSYRTLGVEPEASTSELRSHMALLMRWLHPDVAGSADVDPSRAHLANRVLRAWDDVKTPERRKALSLRLKMKPKRPEKRRGARLTFRKHRSRQPMVARFLSFLTRRPHS